MAKSLFLSKFFTYLNSRGMLADLTTSSQLKLGQDAGSDGRVSIQNLHHQTKSVLAVQHASEFRPRMRGARIQRVLRTLSHGVRVDLVHGAHIHRVHWARDQKVRRAHIGWIHGTRVHKVLHALIHGVWRARVPLIWMARIHRVILRHSLRREHSRFCATNFFFLSLTSQI